MVLGLGSLGCVLGLKSKALHQEVNLDNRTNSP